VLKTPKTPNTSRYESGVKLAVRGCNLGFPGREPGPVSVATERDVEIAAAMPDLDSETHNMETTEPEQER